ncbi:MAG TPA: thioesterase family protein [Nocardioidaceae bacterium]|jgi:acyl-CoA thioester hydrolase
MSRHRYECHVRFSDVDIYRHVNNVKYFEYYQEARLAFLSTLGRHETRGRFSVVVARIQVDYRRPLLFRPEPYVVETWIEDVGRSSYTLGSEIKDDDSVVSSARAVLVGFDRRRQASRELTDDERDRLRAVMAG